MLRVLNGLAMNHIVFGAKEKSTTQKLKCICLSDMHNHLLLLYVHLHLCFLTLYIYTITPVDFPVFKLHAKLNLMKLRLFSLQ